MSSTSSSPAQKLLRPVAAVAVLVVIMMLVISYCGGYRSSGSDDSDSEETTSTVEATATASQDETESEVPVEEIEVESSAKVVVLIEGLNFRTAPSRDADLIRGLGKDEELTHIATEDGWHHVRDADGKEGYVSASDQYTRLEE